MPPKVKGVWVAGTGVLLAAACYFAPYDQHTQWVSWCLWGFLCGFVLPVGVAVALGMPLKNLGLTIGDWKFGAGFLWGGLAVMMGLGVWAAASPDFQAYYAAIAFQHLKSPLSFWLSLAAYMTGWEFLFRGFLLFGLAGTPERTELLPRSGRVWLAIAFSTLLFGLSHFGKPALEVLGSFLAGVILCLVAWRTRSVLAPILLHTLVLGIFTLLVQRQQGFLR